MSFNIGTEMEPSVQSRDRNLPGSSKSARKVPGLGIASPCPPTRHASHHGLIENAAPIDGSSGAAQIPFEDVPPDLHPRAAHSEFDDFRNSIHSAWDRGARKGIYAPLGEERDLGSGLRGARDVDAMSIDSLQMHDETPDEPAKVERGFSGAQDAGPGDYGQFRTRLNERHQYPSRTPSTHVHIKRASWRSIWLLVVSIYSTVLSGIWFVVSMVEPRWGSIVSTNGPISLSSANLVTAIFAKTIELSFVTVAVAFVGQVLTRRAIATHEGMTMAELTMRTWIMQPGAVLANARALRYVGRTLLGIFCILATLVVMFYTTASDTMVRPKLQFSSWQHKTLNSTIFASYANDVYVQDSCATPFSADVDVDAGSSCLAVQYAGDSFSDFLTFFSKWRDVENAGTDMVKRPLVQSMLYDNVTMVGTWIETQFSDVQQNSATYGRVVNNVSLAMPHPGKHIRTGVYKAATNRTLNGILQPSDLDGVGSYNVSASVISPAVNVLCVNMSADELAPLVYTAWPNATSNSTGVGNQTVGWSGWAAEVPVWNASHPSEQWLNRTVVDDIFHWGSKYQRRPPVFQLYPKELNTIINNPDANATDAIYILSTSNKTHEYTLCGLQSWPAIQCSTRFNVSGTASMAMSADCAQDVDYYPENATRFTSNPDAYVHTMSPGSTFALQDDWRRMAWLWAVSTNLNGGVDNANASDARILTELALAEPQLGGGLPSLAEALAAMVANTLVTASVNTPFAHYWDYDVAGGILPEPAMVSFRARVRSQEYASWHTEPWQGVFYAVLGLAFALNLLCLAYLGRSGLVKDFLEPTSLFALATARSAAGPGASTPGAPGFVMARTPEMDQSPAAGVGKNKADLAVPYRLSYREDVDHFFFEQAGAGGKNSPLINNSTATGMELEEDVGSRRGYSTSKLSPRFRF